MSIENTEVTLSQFREFIDFADTKTFGDLQEGLAWGFSKTANGYISVPMPADKSEQFEHVMEAAELIYDVQRGKRKKWVLEEAFSTSDFTILTTNILQWKLINEYIDFPVVYDQITDINRTVPDFRTIKESNLDGLDTPLPQVEENGEYQSTSLAERTYSYNVAKYGRSFGVSWETIVNDFLRAFDRMPRRLAAAARNTENQFVTKLFSQAGGPNASIYTSGNGNLAAAGASGALSFASLSTAYAGMQTRLSPTGNPILARPRILMVPPQLELTALQITKSGNLFATNVPTGAAVQTGVLNPLSTLDLQVVVNPWLPITNTTNGTTAWYLFADKQYGVSMEVGFLAGHDQPELTQRLSNHIYVNGGGIVPPQMGDFDSDAIRWRIRHIIGGTMLDYRFTYASAGV